MKLFNFTSAALAAALIALPGAAFAETFNLKLSTYLPPQHQVNVELSRWADELREKSNGDLNIAVFPAGQMGPPPRQLDLARTGVADMAFVYTALNPGRFPRTDLLAAPFLLSNEQGEAMLAADASWLATSMRDSFAPDTEGVDVLYYVTSTALGFFMNDKQITQPSDLEGLRVRPTSATVANMLDALGASPATIPPTEIADAIGKGVVDGAIFNFEGGKVFGLAQSVKQVSLLGFTSGTFALVINSDTMAKLPANLQQLINDTTGPDAGRRVGGLYDAAEAAGRTFMEGEGVMVHELLGDKATPFREALAGLAKAQTDDLESKGIDADALIAKINDLKSKL